MSENIVQIKQKHYFSRDNIPKREMISEKSMDRPKESCNAKRIVIVSLLIFLIISLFISCAYLYISHNSNKPNSADDQALNLHSLNQKKDRIDSNTPKQNFRKVDSEQENSSDLYNYKRNVLLITNHFSRTKNSLGFVSKDVLYNILLKIKTVNLTVVDAFDPELNNKNIDYLRNFHLVALDFLDGGYHLARRCPTFTKALMQFINEGGALFSTHDQFDDADDKYVTNLAKEMLKLLGFVHKNYYNECWSKTYFDIREMKNSIFMAN